MQVINTSMIIGTGRIGFCLPWSYFVIQRKVVSPFILYIEEIPNGIISSYLCIYVYGYINMHTIMTKEKRPVRDIKIVGM